MITFWAAAVLALTSQHDGSLARAESLLVAGDLRGARRIAERLEDRNPNDGRVLVMLGRIHLAWPVVGRFTAESLFSRAGRLAPAEPEAFYWLGHVGLTLGGDDGEMIARRGLVRVLAINPAYRDAWALWSRLYAGRRDRQAAVASLRPHAGDWLADSYRARLLVDLGEYQEAVPLLVSLSARRPDDIVVRAFHARALFEQGRDADGWTVYQGALDLADRDTAEVLWRQLRSAATPRERETWNATPASGRGDFLRVFWARREPDLLTALNERIGEHFRRMAEARRDFRILHPNARYHRSPLYRSLMAGVNSVPSSEVADIVRRAQDEQCTAGRSDALTRLQYASGLAPRTGTDSSTESPNMEDGLDDRGRIWVRHGRPTARFTYGLDGETWCYARREGTFRVTFVRRTGPSGSSGDVIFTPVLPEEPGAFAALMATDRPSADYRLEFSFWPAQFRNTDGRRTDLLLFPDSVRAVAVLVGPDGIEAARDSSTGHFLAVTTEPGQYLLLLDAERGEERGSYRGTMSLPEFGSGELAISSLLVASGDVVAERGAMAAAAPAGLRLAAGAPLRFYAELYGLGRATGVSRYEARYRFERLDGPSREREIVVSFRREQPFTPRVIETLVVDPGRFEPGRYRVRLEIRDDVRGVSAAGAAMEFRLR